VTLVLTRSLQDTIYLTTAPGLPPQASHSTHGLQLSPAGAMRPPAGSVSTGQLPLAASSSGFHSGAGVGDDTWQQGGQQQHQGQQVPAWNLLPPVLYQQFGSLIGLLSLGPSGDPAAIDSASEAAALDANVFDDPVSAAVAASAAHSAAQQTQGVFSMDLPAVGAAELAIPCAPQPLSPNSTERFFTSDAEALMSTGQGAAAAAAAVAVGTGTAAAAGSFRAPAGAAQAHGSAVVQGARAAAAKAAAAAEAASFAQQQFARLTGALRLPPGSAGGTAAAVGSGSAALVGLPKATVNVSADRASAAWVCENFQCTWRVVLTQSFSAHGHSAKGSRYTACSHT